MEEYEQLVGTQAFLNHQLRDPWNAFFRAPHAGSVEVF